MSADPSPAAAEPPRVRAHRRSALGADLIIPLLAVSLTSYYMASTASLTWEARSTGWLIGLILLALCALQFARIGARCLDGGATLGLGDLVGDTQNNRRRLGLLGLMSLFVAALPLTGITLGLFLVLAVGMIVMGVRRPGQIVGIAAATAGTVFVMFIVLLKSRLPRGPIDHALLALFS